MRKRNLLLLMLLIGVWLLPVGIVRADLIPVDFIIYQPDPGLPGGSLSARVEFTNSYVGTGLASSYDLYIKVTNTSGNLSPSDFPSSVILTGIGFDLPAGVDILTGAMSLSNYHVGSQSNPSKIWGYDNEVEGGPFSAFPSVFSVNTAISTLAASVDFRFSSSLPLGNVDGPDGGVMSAGELSSPPSSWNYYTNYAWIGLDLNGVFSIESLNYAALNGDLVVAFGSPTAPVPEPATMLLLGTGLIGLAGIGRKKLRKA